MPRWPVRGNVDALERRMILDGVRRLAVRDLPADLALVEIDRGDPCRTGGLHERKPSARSGRRRRLRLARRGCAAGAGRAVTDRRRPHEPLPPAQACARRRVARRCTACRRIRPAAARGPSARSRLRNSTIHECAVSGSYEPPGQFVPPSARRAASAQRTFDLADDRRREHRADLVASWPARPPRRAAPA